MGREHCLVILRGATHIQCAKRTLGLLLREGDRTRLRVRSSGVFPVFLAVGALSMALGSACSQRSLWFMLAAHDGSAPAPSLSGGVNATHPDSAR